jgi:hypothetical protein
MSVDDVMRAGRVLFGPRFSAEAAGWRDALRATWRRRAMETHPDRASALGRPEGELAREFEAVADAYRILSSLGAEPDAAAPPGPPSERVPRQAARSRPEAAGGARGSSAVPPRVAPARSGPRARAVRPEDLPQRKLRFAEYLYYAGRVRWSELADAIAWQRSQRPAVGRIAVELGFLGPDDVGVILERRREAGANGVPFGEWAVRLGYLTPFQLLAALGRQFRFQRPIGEFFVARGMLEPDDVEDVRARILQHNARWSRAASRPAR